MSDCVKIYEDNNKKRGFFSTVILTLNAIDIFYKKRNSFLLDVLKLYGDCSRIDCNWSYFFENFDYCTDNNKYFEITNANWIVGRPKENNFNILSKQIKEYLKLNSFVKNKIENFSKKFDIENCIGVHIRKTDHNIHGNFINDSIYEDIIKSESANSNIFLATDDENILNYYLKKYENKICYTDSLRVTGPMGIHWSERNKSVQENLKSGYDVLFDAILLSMCKKQYFTNSNISTFAISYAIANNFNLNYNFIDKHIEYS